MKTKTYLISTLALTALLALPGAAQAKERGCGYRLASLSDARVQLARVLKRGGNVDFARAQLTRAKIKAAEEGCRLTPVRSRRIAKHRHVEARRDFWRAKAWEVRKLRYERFAAQRRYHTLLRVRTVRPLSFSERRELFRLRTRWDF